MKARFVWLCLGLAFAVTLAVVIGQRLSAEAMSVMVGVVAGVAASIPTSLIVVWFATRTLTMSRPAPPLAPQPTEPRIIVVPHGAVRHLQADAMYSMGGYSATGYGVATIPQPLFSGQGGMQTPLPQMFAPRQFNVIGGSEAGVQDFESRQEVVWPQ